MKKPKSLFVRTSVLLHPALFLFIIHCGQTAKNPQLVMDMMQATQPQQCHALEPLNMNTEDKIVLSPIVFQGKNPIEF